MRRNVTGLALALTLTACGGAGDPATQPSPAPTTATPSPTPTPTLPAVAEDKKLAAEALVTAADLGKPWVVQKKVNTAKNAKGELCPGQPNAREIVKPRAQEARFFTEGGKAGAAIASFRVRTHAFGQEQQWRDAVAASQQGCRSWTSAEKLYVELEPVASPPAVEGADEVLVHVERIYADKTKQTLHYVRHYYEARTGRVVTSFELAYVQPKSDPTGSDLTKSAALLEKQIAKTRQAFGL